MKAKPFIALIACLMAFVGTGASSATVERKAEIDAILPTIDLHLQTLYRTIHSHPELAFQEVRTAALLAREMRHLGFTVTEHVGGTGVVAIYKNGPGPVVMVRTELDALPIEEKTGLPYASRVQAPLNEPSGRSLTSASARDQDRPLTIRTSFVSHACGHDTHMASWVGIAQTLVRLKARWSGTLVFVAQPAEETLSGAKAMLADGLLTRFPRPQFGFAAHVIPLPAGVILLKEGPALAAADNLSIVFHGRGGHVASPTSTIDPILIGARFVNDLQAVVGHDKDPTAPGLIGIGSFRAGDVGNAVPDEARLDITLRSELPATRAEMLAAVLRMARAAANTAGGPPPDVDEASETSVMVNDPALSAQLVPVMRQAFGSKLVVIPTSEPVGMASDDYSQFVEAGIPSVYFAVGGMSPATLAQFRAKGEPVPVNHSSAFHPEPDATIRTSVELLSLAVMAVAPGGTR